MENRFLSTIDSIHIKEKKMKKFFVKMFDPFLKEAMERQEAEKESVEQIEA